MGSSCTSNLYCMHSEGSIDQLFFLLEKENLAHSMERLEDDSVIRINKTDKKGQPLYVKYIDNSYYDKCYHGTLFDNLPSIMRYGLQFPGAKMPGNYSIDVRRGHIIKEKKLFNVKQWGNAIFASPSIRYAGLPHYSEQIEFKGRKYCCIVEMYVKKNKYEIYKSTVDEYVLSDKENELLEIRIPTPTKKFQKNLVVVVATLFVLEELIQYEKPVDYEYINNLVNIF